MTREEVIEILRKIEEVRGDLPDPWEGDGK